MSLAETSSNHFEGTWPQAFYLKVGMGEPCAGQVRLRLLSVCLDTWVVVRSSEGSLGRALPIGSVTQQ